MTDDVAAQLEQQMPTTDLVAVDSVPVPAALLDEHGVIRAVNDAWIAFGRANGSRDPAAAIGFSYEAWLDAPDELVARAAAGVIAVAEGHREEFSYSYPCHSPTEERWFRFLVVPMSTERSQRSVLTLHVPLEPGADRRLRELGEDALDQRDAGVVICAWCQVRARSADGSWFTRSNSDPLAGPISHGICPDCASSFTTTPTPDT